MPLHHLKWDQADFMACLEVAPSIDFDDDSYAYEVSQDGLVHGRRNAMLDDSDVHWHRQIKSCVGGVTAAVTGDPAVFVSVSAAHQGPDGGGPVAAIVDLGDNPTGYRWP